MKVSGIEQGRKGGGPKRLTLNYRLRKRAGSNLGRDRLELRSYSPRYLNENKRLFLLLHL